jgi:hypothetical protein
MIEISNELIGLIVTAFVAAIGWYKEYKEKRAIIEFEKPENDVYQIPKGVEKTAYIVNDKTRGMILAGLSNSEKFTVNDLIDDNNEYVLKSGETIEYWIHTSRGSYFINWRGMIGDVIGTEPEPIPEPMKPSGYALPTYAQIKSGDTVEFKVFYNPDSGADRVTEIDVDWGDGTPLETHSTFINSNSITMQHKFEYSRTEKYTGTTYYPKFVYHGARGTTMVLEKAISVAVEA